MNNQRQEPPLPHVESCVRCGRPVLFPLPQERGNPHVEKAVVRHAYYGCGTGCCGHEVIGVDCNGEQAFRAFDFAHPYSDDKETWARSFADDHLRGVPLDWPSCEVSDD